MQPIPANRFSFVCSFNKRQRQESGGGGYGQRLRQRGRGGFEKLTARAHRIAFFSVGAAVTEKRQLRCHPLFAFALCYPVLLCGGMRLGDLVLLRRKIKSERSRPCDNIVKRGPE